MNNSYSFYEARNSLNHSLDRNCYYLEINLDVPLYVFIANITVSVINGVSSVVAVMAKSLVLVALWKNPSLHR